MTSAALPAGYRVQILRRSAKTPPAIRGEWVVHCTLCKWTGWVDTRDEALALAHVEHPQEKTHQKWIGRVLTGGEPHFRRGYHFRTVDNRNQIVEDHWTPASVPLWVRRRGTVLDGPDDLRKRRREQQRKQAQSYASTAVTGAVPTGSHRRFLVTERTGEGYWQVGVECAVRFNGLTVARIWVLNDGRVVHRQKVYNLDDFVRTEGWLAA